MARAQAPRWLPALALLLAVLLVLLAACTGPDLAPAPAREPAPLVEAASAVEPAPATQLPGPTPFVSPTPLPLPVPEAPVDDEGGEPEPPVAPRAPAPAPAQARFEPSECWFQPLPGRNVDCGYLHVPEARGDPASSMIRLPVAIVRSGNTAPAPDPVVYLGGGPGSRTVDGVPWISQAFNAILEERDLILFDQRGAGRAEPSLDCPELNSLVEQLLEVQVDLNEKLRLEAEAAAECRQRLVAEGVDLSAYDSAASAADVSDLRVALGIEEWNLYGISYGTRLALTVMRDFPQGIRSVILDSTYPPQVDLYAGVAVNAARAFDLLFAHCERDERCGRAYPDLETRFFQLVADLDAQPVTVEVDRYSHSGASDGFRVVVDGHLLIETLFRSLYSTDVIPHLPAMIADMGQGNYHRLTGRLESTLFIYEAVNQGMNFAVQCAEELPFSADDSAGAAAQPVHPRLQKTFQSYLDGYFMICDRWQVEQAAPLENEPVVSEIPALILSGELDPITPPAWGKLAARTLSRSRHYEFPGVGHGAIFSRHCAVVISQSFLVEPESTPDDSCIDDLEGIHFFTP